MWERLGLPKYQPPAAFSEDLVINAEGKTYTVKRAVDGPMMRTDMTMDGQNMTMIEMGDERGTMYMLMPDQKEATKMSNAAMDEMTGGKMSKMENKAAEDNNGVASEPTNVTVEDLGDDTVNGIAARKMHLMSSDGDVVAWFDKSTGGPLKMESTSDGKTASIEWQNHKAGPQDKKLFEVPKGYKVNDMDEMVAQMKKMGGMEGMAKGMVPGMTQGMGQNLGAQLGSSFGGALGGPLGAMAGQYIGGRVGGAIGKKAGDTVAH
ncbi:MAG TPA: hypothetical protein VFH88_01530 [Candidatus Krumholzibacteria bacterium]|nr:hypothetical protein [Candidatus Krumholzibacteria bacterium]